MESETTGPPAAVRTAIVIAAVACAAFLALVQFSGVSAGGMVHAAAPTGYTPYAAADKAFACEGPRGWSARSFAGGATSSGVVFEKGDAKIDVTADLSLSLIGDISKTPGSMPDVGGLPGAPGLSAPPKPRRPIETVHDLNRHAVAGDLKNYDEQPAHDFTGKFGEARYSEFTGEQGLFGGKVHGFRVTMLGGERGISLVAQCPEADWAALEPAFRHVIESLGPGG